MPSKNYYLSGGPLPVKGIWPLKPFHVLNKPPKIDHEWEWNFFLIHWKYKFEDIQLRIAWQAINEASGKKTTSIAKLKALLAKKNDFRKGKNISRNCDETFRKWLTNLYC